MFERTELDDVRRFYSGLPEAQPTPLRRLAGLASRLGLAELLVKDESNRFGLPAFKILGTRYAVARLLEQGAVGDLACATAGNHGLAVARAAQLASRPAHVYVPRGTSPARTAAIRSEGAEVVTTDTGYDEAVRVMARDASEHGWTVVSDMAWTGYEQVPRWIMAGYGWMLDESALEWGPTPPDLVVVQAGVGSLAGGVAGWLQATCGANRPRLVVVEPRGSACVAGSLERGRRVSLDVCEPTTMAGLRCAEVSPLAWPVLRDTVDAAVQISEEDASWAVGAMAEPVGADPSIEAGPSGAAGLAGLMRLVTDSRLGSVRSALGISARTRALVINTEGPTDR
jgi:diaminopropionate ammonia-lyase family